MPIDETKNTADLGTETLSKHLFYNVRDQDFPKVTPHRVLVLGGVSIGRYRHRHRAVLNDMIARIIVAIVLSWHSIMVDRMTAQSSSSRSSSDIEIEIVIGDRDRAISNVIVSAVTGSDRARVFKSLL